MNKLFYYFILSTKKWKALKCFSMDLDGSVGLVGKPLSVGSDFGEDAGFAGAGAGSKRNNADDVVGAGTVGADEGSAGVAHAGRPALAGFAKADDVIGKAPVLSQKLAGTPDSAGDLLETISEGLRVTLDQAPSREHAVLGSTVVLASWSQAGGSSVGAREVDGGGCSSRGRGPRRRGSPSRCHRLSSSTIHQHGRCRRRGSWFDRSSEQRRGRIGFR